MGLKPLLVGEYSTKSNSTRSDPIDPFFSAAVQVWSPSSVRSRIATSVLLRLVEIDEACLRQRLAHVVHVETQFAFGEQLALALLIRRALFAFCHHVGGVLAADHHDAVIIGDDRIARHPVAPAA